MTGEEFGELIQSVAKKCVALKNTYIEEKELEIDYICLFSHTPEEYREFLTYASRLGTVVDDTKTGPVFAFHTPPSTRAGRPKVLKIRKPDPTRPQLGDVDFTSDYQTFKDTYLNKKGFSLVQRENFEMMELKDGSSDVLVYFSSVPPSALLGVTEEMVK